MIGLLGLAACILATVRLYGSSLFVVALVVAIANFWSLGVMHNRKGEPVGSLAEAHVVTVNFLTSLAGIVLLIVSFTLSK